MAGSYAELWRVCGGVVSRLGMGDASPWREAPADLYVDALAAAIDPDDRPDLREILSGGRARARVRLLGGQHACQLTVLVEGDPRLVLCIGDGLVQPPELPWGNPESRADDEAMHRHVIEREKLAALGGLVAGVAHEINTPLGIAVTAASHLAEEATRIKAKIEGNTLRKSDLVAFEQAVEQSVGLILNNLQRAATLVRSFKQVAADQAVEDVRVIEVYEYLHDIVSSLGPKLKGTGVIVDIDCPAEIEFRTVPGALYQIISNLVINSLIHAFEGVANPRIDITAHRVGDQLQLVYRDNGRGMSEVVRARAFEPFFTTRRGQGGTGLGLHIVYNLVRQTLKGELALKSAEGQGFELTMCLPLYPAEEVSDCGDGSTSQRLDEGAERPLL